MFGGKVTPAAVRPTGEGRVLRWQMMKAGEMGDSGVRELDWIWNIPEIDSRGLDDKLVSWFRR